MIGNCVSEIDSSLVNGAEAVARILSSMLPRIGEVMYDSKKYAGGNSQVWDEVNGHLESLAALGTWPQAADSKTWDILMSGEALKIGQDKW
ncbi:hypothetical protein AZE42_12896 [Rhizopogon vesiculosus]|uniref:Uncharacterized protein n=1 Tax=Rhizopogon vesiculosus TaxID=180088 RepID=A0A1J8QG26_9AGAM|nr:hypothetical protein AZE42_12896 [Rhizopogon vesiculosus]